MILKFFYPTATALLFSLAWFPQMALGKITLRSPLVRSNETFDDGKYYNTQQPEIASPQETRTKARRTLRQGTQLYEQGTVESWRQAIEKYQEALQLWQEVDDPLWEAFTLNQLARVHWDLRELRIALDYYNQALPLTREEHSQALEENYLEAEAIILYNMGSVYSDLGEDQAALDYYNQSLPILQVIRDREREAKTLNKIGLIYYDMGQLQQALDSFQQVLPIRRELLDREGEANALHNLSFVYHDLGQRQEALDSLRQALPLWKELDFLIMEVRTLSLLGQVCLELGKPQTALDYYNQALPLARVEHYREEEAAILDNIGEIYSDLGESQTALDYYNQALPIRREVKDREGEAATLNHMGWVYLDLESPQQALAVFQQALPIFRELDDRIGEVLTLTGLGRVHFDLGELRTALVYYEQGLPLARTETLRYGEAVILNLIGLVYSVLGEPQTALNYYNQVLPIRREVEDRKGEGTTLNNRGLVYADLGNLQRALDDFQQALIIRREVKDREGEASTLNNLGTVYYAIGELEQALDYFEQALPIRREMKDRQGEAATLTNLGVVYEDLGQPQEALDSLQQALHIEREVRYRLEEASTLNNIGWHYRIMGDLQQALDYYNQALSIRKEIGDRFGEAITLGNIAGVNRALNRPLEAVDFLEKSVQITLNIRSNLRRENRQLFLEREGNTAIALADLLIEQNQPERAFEWLNRVTSFDLADYTRILDASVADPEAQEALNDWKEQNQQLQFQRLQLQENFSDDLSRRIRTLEAEVAQRAEDLIARFPEIADLLETTPEDIQLLRSTIPEGTVVIQPVLLTNINNIPNNLALFVLSKNQPLTVTKVPIDPTEFDALVTTYREQLQNHLDPNYTSAQEQLYDLLIRPIEAEIAAASPTELSFILTGKLRYIPFETLYDRQNNQYLLEKYPINYLTRLSARNLSSPSVKNSTQSVLALGNPVPIPPQDLPISAKEAHQVAEIFPNSEVYLEEEATLDVFKTQAPRFSILHLATHGCFDPAGCPNLEMEANTLLFSDRLYDIKDAALLGLNDTQLITLSACQTAKSTEADGSEISGLAYLFERAGAQAVIASLWNTDDATSRDLMVAFYQRLNNGATKAEALRQAKLQYIDEHPFFWSPLVLIGDASGL